MTQAMLGTTSQLKEAKLNSLKATIKLMNQIAAEGKKDGVHKACTTTFQHLLQQQQWSETMKKSMTATIELVDEVSVNGKEAVEEGVLNATARVFAKFALGKLSEAERHGYVTSVVLDTIDQAIGLAIRGIEKQLSYFVTAY